MSSKIKQFTLDELIENSLRQTLRCEFKSKVIDCLLGKGYTCIKIKTFSKKLAGEIKQAQFLNQIDEEENNNG